MAKGKRVVVAAMAVLVAFVALPPMGAGATEAPIAPVWVNLVNTTARSNTTALAKAPNGDVVSVGWFEGQATFGSGASAVTVSSAGGSEAFVTRTRADGSLVWARAAGGAGWDQAQGVAVAPGGAIYVWGGFNGSMSFRGSSPPLVLSGADTYGNGDGFVARYDANGVPQWARRAGGANVDGMTAGAVDLNGWIVLHASVQTGNPSPPTIDTGVAGGTQVMTGSSFVRYDTTGVLRAVVTSDPNLSVRKIISRGDGTFAVGGTTTATDPYDSAIVEVHDASLAYLSARVVAGGGAGTASLNDMAYDSKGNLTVVGMVEPNARLGNGDPLTFSEYHGYVASFTPSGAMRWSDTPKSVLYDVAVRPGDGVVVDAFFNPSAYPPPPFQSTYGGSDGITLRTDGPAPNGTGIAVAEYEANGAIRSAQVIRNNDFAIPGPILVDGANVYVTGMIRGSSTFGLGAGAIVTPTPTPNDFRGFVAKFTGRTTSQLADLRADVASVPVVLAIGTSATVTAHVRNTGPDTATNTKASLSLGAGLSLLAATPNVGSVSGTTWTIGNLARDAQATITLTIGGTSAGSLGGLVTVTASSDAIEVSQGEEVATTMLGIDADGATSPDLGWVHRVARATTVDAVATTNGGAFTAVVAGAHADVGVGADSRRVPATDVPIVAAVTQTDATGTVQWTRAIDFDNALSPSLVLGGVGTDSAGNVFVAGVLAGPARVEHGDGTTTTLVPPADPNNQRPAYLASWGPDGAFRFADVAISRVSPNDGVGIDVLPDGTVYLGATLYSSALSVFGPSYGTLTPPPPSMGIAAAVGAFDSTGHPLWAQLVRGAASGDTTLFRALDADANGVTVADVLVAASPSLTATFMVTPVSPAGGQGTAVALGVSKNFTSLTDVARGPNGQIGVVGTYSGGMTIGSLPPLPDTAGLGSNGWVALVQGGAPQWSTALAGDAKEHLDAAGFDGGGHLVVGGGTYQTTTATIAGQSVPAGGGFLAVVADDHTVIRSLRTPNGVLATEGVQAIGLEANGDVLFAGVHSGSTTVGSAPVTQLRLAGAYAATLTAASAPPSAVAGVVTDAADHPWSGAVVTVVAESPAWAVVGTATTDAAGHYQLAVPPGTYRVRVFDPQNRFDRMWYASSTTYTGATPVVVAANLTTTVDVQATRTGGDLRGHVVDGTSTPLVGIWVQVFDDDGYVAGATTDASGGYRVALLPGGAYHVRFVDLNGTHANRWWRSSATRAGSDPVTVVYPTGAVADMTLP